LRGRDVSLLDTLEREMTAASESLAFEKAAALRDRLDVLRWLEERLGRLRSARDQQSFVYPVRGQDGGELWYLIHGGRVLAAVSAPQDEADARSVRQALHKVFTKRRLEKDPVPAEELDGVLLVAAWFHRHPEEKERVVSPPQIFQTL